MKDERIFLKSDLANLVKARLFISKKAKELGADETDITKIEISCDEWSANVIEHGLGDKMNKGFSIECRSDGNKFIIIYEHEGEKFNPIEQQVINVDNHFSKMKERGLGIYIMREMMDEIHYEYCDDRINKLTMVKYLDYGK
jgi:anti-sigma regulatory factor (Ser/Thr protein kinase)